MNIPGPLRNELFALWNQATAMVEHGMQTAHDIAETMLSALPYAAAVALLALVFSTWIQEAIEKVKKNLITWPLKP